MTPPGLTGFDWNLLVVLDALYAERNVTRAGKRIGLSQSAMSHALARLRGELGDDLFVATPRGMAATPRAAALERSVRDAVSSVRQAFAMPAPFDPTTATPTFRLATSDYGALAVLPSLVADLARRAPGLDLIVRSPTGCSAVDLVRGDLDFELTVAGTTHRGVRSLALFADDFVCVRRRPRGGAPKLTLARFAEMPHVLVSPRGEGDAPVDVALRKVGKKRRIVLRIAHFLAAPLVLARTDYVMTVPTRLAAVFAGMLPLQIEPPPLPVPGFTTELQWHERHDEDPAHAFVRGRMVSLMKGGTSGSS